MRRERREERDGAYKESVRVGCRHVADGVFATFEDRVGELTGVDPPAAGAMVESRCPKDGFASRS